MVQLGNWSMGNIRKWSIEMITSIYLHSSSTTPRSIGVQVHRVGLSMPHPQLSSTHDGLSVGRINE